jgi:elongation factor G
MKAYETPFIRNVGIVGHGDTGKTQLVSALLFTAGMTNRLGKVTEGTTVTDWDEEEIARKISIQTSLAYAEWAASGQTEKTKINFLDTPGYSTFVNEARASLVAADAALIVVDAVAGVQVVTEKVWDYATEYDLPRAFVINWMDRELASFDRALASITQVFGRGVVAVHLPIGEEKNFRGVIDLISMKAHVYQPDGDGKAKIEEIPAEMAEAAKAAHEALVEMVAEGDDALMEEFFEKGTLPIEDLMKGLRDRVSWRSASIRCALTSALHNIGSPSLLDLIVADCFPILRRAATVGHTARRPGRVMSVERRISDAEPVSIFVYKTLADPFAGRINYFKVNVRHAEK